VGEKERDQRNKHLEGERGFALSHDPDWKCLKDERLNYWRPGYGIEQEQGIRQGQMTVIHFANNKLDDDQDEGRCERDNKPFNGNPPTEGPRRSLAIPLEMRLDPTHWTAFRIQV
jgi:hypothetical protein